MMNEKEQFKDAMEVALDGSKLTGKKYYILFPSIANPGYPKENVFLIIPVLHETALQPEELDDVAFTVHPNGEVHWGNTPKSLATIK